MELTMPRCNKSAGQLANINESASIFPAVMQQLANGVAAQVLANGAKSEPADRWCRAL
jgi:hypothetical protein